MKSMKLLLLGCLTASSGCKSVTATSAKEVGATDAQDLALEILQALDEAGIPSVVKQPSRSLALDDKNVSPAQGYGTAGSLAAVVDKQIEDVEKLLSSLKDGEPLFDKKLDRIRDLCEKLKAAADEPDVSVDTLNKVSDILAKAKPRLEAYKSEGSRYYVEATDTSWYYVAKGVTRGKAQSLCTGKLSLPTSLDTAKLLEKGAALSLRNSRMGRLIGPDTTFWLKQTTINSKTIGYDMTAYYAQFSPNGLVERELFDVIDFGGANTNTPEYATNSELRDVFCVSKGKPIDGVASVTADK